MLFSPMIMQAAAVEPRRTAADLLDTFLRHDFLPRFDQLRGKKTSSKRELGDHADELEGNTLIGGGVVGVDGVDRAGETEDSQTSVDLRTDYEWIEAAWRAGRERYAMRQFMHQRPYGHHLVSLVAEVTPSRRSKEGGSAEQARQ